MSVESLAAVAAALLSLLFSYMPGLAGRYEGLSPTAKRLVMLGALLVVALGSFGIACAGWAGEFGLELECSSRSALVLVRTFLAALAANQATYLITPKPETR